jgi:hypothetical protein
MNGHKMTDSQVSTLPIVEVNSLSFVNVMGGTGVTNWNHNSKLDGPIKVRVVGGFDDYESGYRFTGISCDDRLKAYLDKVASKSDQRVFFSQFEIIGDTSDAFAEKLLDQVLEAGVNCISCGGSPDMGFRGGQCSACAGHSEDNSAPF